MDYERRIVSSALWAAYGDALGFITELADDERQVRQRLGGSSLPVTTTRSWRRMIGGRFGVQVTLPAGCYSDDTQLRLATSRAIRGSGEFDIEAFSKVELPVWLTYQLGGGRGTKAAATALSRRTVSWMGNFYEKPSKYIDAGGNGAAMRIQPHVWSAKNVGLPSTFLRDVLRNSIVTHGHPRGFVGAALHALLLAQTMNFVAIPQPIQWNETLDLLDLIPGTVQDDEQLSTFWLPQWERETRKSLKVAVEEVIRECRADLELIRNAVSSSKWDYTLLVKRIGGFSVEHRGSGTKSVLLSLALASRFQDQPHTALEFAANCLTSDTDSIATLAGALLGAVHPVSPPGEVADAGYITNEAVRIAESRKTQVSSFQYPNLTKWTPPSSATSVVGVVEDARIAVVGLGFAQPVSEVISANTKSHGQWQWFELEFGQRVLARIRDPLPQLKASGLPASGAPKRRETLIPQAELFQSAPEVQQHSDARDKKRQVESTYRNREAPVSEGLSLDEATDLVVNGGFVPQLIGDLLLDFARRPNGLELSVAFAAVVAKARIARLKRSSTPRSTPGQHRNPPPPTPSPETSAPSVTQRVMPIE